MRRSGTAHGEMAKAAADAAGCTYDLRLYLVDQAPRSLAALENLRAICKRHLRGRYRLRVVDVCREPLMVKRDQIVATPTVVRRRPGPVRRLIGDLSDTRRVMEGLNLACPPLGK